MEISAVSRVDGQRAVVFGAAVTLLFLALAPAWLRGNGFVLPSLAIAAFFRKLCHQRPERSLIFLGTPAAVCVRCLGIYAGAAIGGLFRMDRGLALRCLAATLALNCMDAAAESLGLHANMPPLRFLIGGTLGFAIGAIFSARGVPVSIYPEDISAKRRRPRQSENRDGSPTVSP